MTDQREETILEILKREIRLVCANNGEVCQDCGEMIDATYRVKDGNLAHCAKLIADALNKGASPQQ